MSDLSTEADEALAPELLPLWNDSPFTLYEAPAKNLHCAVLIDAQHDDQVERSATAIAIAGSQRLFVELAFVDEAAAAGFKANAISRLAESGSDMAPSSAQFTVRPVGWSPICSTDDWDMKWAYYSNQPPDTIWTAEFAGLACEERRRLVAGSRAFWPPTLREAWLQWWQSGRKLLVRKAVQTRRLREAERCLHAWDRAVHRRSLEISAWFDRHLAPSAQALPLRRLDDCVATYAWIQRARGSDQQQRRLQFSQVLPGLTPWLHGGGRRFLTPGSLAGCAKAIAAIDTATSPLTIMATDIGVKAATLKRIAELSPQSIDTPSDLLEYLDLLDRMAPHCWPCASTALHFVAEAKFARSVLGRVGLRMLRATSPEAQAVRYLHRRWVALGGWQESGANEALKAFHAQQLQMVNDAIYQLNLALLGRTAKAFWLFKVCHWTKSELEQADRSMQRTAYWWGQLLQAGLPAVLKFTRRWHEVDRVHRSVDPATSDQQDWPVPELAVHTADRRVVFLGSERDLQIEGERLGHCVGGYAMHCLHGTALVASVQTLDGKPQSTIELAMAPTGEMLGMRQHYGQDNSLPDPECVAAAQEFLKELDQWLDSPEQTFAQRWCTMVEAGQNRDAALHRRHLQDEHWLRQSRQRAAKTVAEALPAGWRSEFLADAELALGESVS